MAPALAFGGIALGLCAIMALVWAITLKPGRSGWIDVVWSLATGGAGVLAALVPLNVGQAPSQRQLLVAALVLAWSLRLGLHIAARTAPGHDDPRYAALRADWGVHFAVRSFWFLQIQAVAAMILAGVAALAAHNPAGGLPLAGWRVRDATGALIVLLGMAGEALADRQLQQFRREPAYRGQVCDRGLWSVSRHPNYFCEWLVWVGLALIALPFSGGYAAGWLALGGPALMYWLLVHVSGIPPLEEHMVRSRGEVFRAYQARTNAFWPGPPRREA